MAQAPSLAQARVQSNNGNNDDNQKPSRHRRHLHSHLRPRHKHSGKHTRPHVRLDEQQHRAPERDLPKLDRRLTEVVQTVSVVQVVNESGVAVETKTYLPNAVSSSVPPAETAPPSALELTAGLSSNLDSSSTAEAASSSGDDAYPEATTSATLSSTFSLLSTVSSIASISSDSGTVTSAPSSTITSFPTLSGLYNSTSRPSFYNNTSIQLFPNATTTSFHRSKSSSIQFSTSSTTSSGTFTTDAAGFSAAGGADGTVAGETDAGATNGAAPTSTPTDSSSDSGGLTPTTTSVIGGIVGGVAGIALVAVALMMFLRWKRARGNSIKLLGDNRGPSGRLSLFSSRSGPGDGGPGMTGPSGTFGVPAALASLTAYKQSPKQQPVLEDAPDTNEKGFYRVSGRKLVSVLESGGDGFSEPPPGSRDSNSRSSANTTTDNRLSAATDDRMSGASFWRPDSMAFLSSTDNPLQLGSPMRPESGIMVVRDSPARTPMQEQGPIFDNTQPLNPATPLDPATPLSPPTPHDPLGRSFLGHSGSAISTGSRFTEGV
ncbi:hypothetical protein DL546_003962 [Coniochaeta pulveracea]|uniref:Mid2 domain-containing protein n=1 Tax=Coniochaeta pulveracea TaxID=177199 RepID=A0A420Y6A8_9PEZI|nr:hypothetical protein DL546_003962 [Coniochaeta pulveracea]